MSTEEGASTPVTKAEFSELLSAMNAVKEQMKEMKRGLSQDRDAADERLVKKMRMDKGVQFKRKANEKQHQFNDLVQDSIEVAQKSLGAVPPAIEKAKESLKEGEKLLKDRQKLIRIADRSEYGWATVSEYEEDELADGSDDEKRLYRAEMRAGKKAKAGKAAKRKQFPRRDSWAWKPRWQPQSSGVSDAVASQPSSSSAAKFPSTGRPQSMLGPCFNCGKMGHLKNACPGLLLKNLMSNQGK
jgi:hypothetical protein